MISVVYQHRAACSTVTENTAGSFPLKSGTKKHGAAQEGLPGARGVSVSFPVYTNLSEIRTHPNRLSVYTQAKNKCFCFEPAS